MAKKIQIDIEVNGKMRKATVSVNQLKSALKGVDEQQKKVSKSAGETDRNTKGVAQASSSATKNFSKMSQGMGGLVGAYATLAAQIFAISAAFNFLKTAGNLDSLQKGQNAYAASTGIAMRTLTNDIIAATEAQVSFQDAAQAGAIGVAAGLSTQQITQLGTAAKDASIILGRDVTDSFNRLVRGVTKAEPELLDELGIILRLKDASEAYARELGINANELSQFQKSQAVANDVLGQAEQKYSRIIDIVDPGVNKFNQLGKAFDDIVNQLRTLAVDIATPLANLFIEFPQVAYAGFLLIGRGVLTAALPALTQFSGEMDKLAEKSSKAFKAAEDDIARYQRTMKAASGDPKAAQAVGVQGLKDAKAALKAGKITSARKGSGLEAILGGKQATTRQLAAMKKAAVAGAGAYKDMSDKMRRDFVRSLDDMIISQKAKNGTLVIQAETTGQKMGVGYAKLKAGAQRAFSAVTGFASKAGAAISKAFFWIQIATLAFSAGKLAYDFFFKSNKQVDEAITKQTMLSNKLKSLNQDYDKFAEIQKVMLEDAPNALNFFASLGQVVGSLTSKEFKLLIQQFDTLTVKFTDFKQASIEARDSFQESADQLSGMSLFTKALLAGGEQDTFNKVQEQTLKALNRETENAKMTLLEFVKANEDVEDSTKSAAKFLQEQLDAYSAMRDEVGGVSKAGDAYFASLQALNRGEEVNIKTLLQQRDAFIEVGGAITEAGKMAEANKQQVSDFVRAFSGANTESRILTQIRKEREKILEIAADTTVINQTRLDQLAKEEEFVKTILDAQYKIKLDLATLDIQSLKIARGASNGQKARLKIDQDIAKNSIKQNELQLAIASTIGAAKTEGRELEEQELRSIELNQQKLELLRQQSADLIRQTDAASQYSDAIKNSFESGFSQGLSDLIKNKEGSLKESIRNLALGVLESIADVLSRRLTDTVMDFIFPTEDPATKIKAAHVEGAQIVASAIVAAHSGKSPTIPGPLGTSVDIPKPGLPDQTNPSATKTQPEKLSYLERIFGAKEMKGQDEVTMGSEGGIETLNLNKTGGSFGNFLGSLGDIFNKNAEGGLVEKLGNAFSAGGNLFGDIFGGLPDLFGGLFDSLGGLFGAGGAGGGGLLSGLASMIPGIGPILGGAMSLFGFKNGGIMNNGSKVAGYAAGGIADGPSKGHLAMLHGREAVVPLPNGNSIPVQMNGNGGMQNNNVTVNVSTDGQVQSSSNGAMGENLGQVIAAAVQKELHNQKRAGGILNKHGAA